MGWCVRWSFAALLFLGMMGLAAYFVFINAVEGGRYIVVPDVVGRPVTQASNLIASQGLEIGQQRSVSNPNVPPYHVILQRPAANKVVRAGRRVDLTISKGHEESDVPMLIGKTVDEAKLSLDTEGLVLGSIARIPHDNPKDTILSQDPGPSLAAYSGGEVHVLVSDGRAGNLRSLMPNLVGMSLDEAEQALRGLNVSLIPHKVDLANQPYDVILTQRPDPGVEITGRQPVRIEIRPSPMTEIPNARRDVQIQYVSPRTSDWPLIRVVRVSPTGERDQIYPLAKDFVNGNPPVYPADSTFTIPVPEIQGGTTVEFYSDNKLHKTYYFDEEGEPAVTTFLRAPEGRSARIRSENLPGGSPRSRSRARIIDLFPDR